MMPLLRELRIRSCVSVDPISRFEAVKSGPCDQLQQSYGQCQRYARVHADSQSPMLFSPIDELFRCILFELLIISSQRSWCCKSANQRLSRQTHRFSACSGNSSCPEVRILRSDQAAIVGPAAQLRSRPSFNQASAGLDWRWLRLSLDPGAGHEFSRCIIPGALGSTPGSTRFASGSVLFQLQTPRLTAKMLLPLESVSGSSTALVLRSVEPIFVITWK